MGGDPFHSTEEGVPAASDLYPTLGSDVGGGGGSVLSDTEGNAGRSLCLALFARFRLDVLLLRLCLGACDGDSAAPGVSGAGARLVPDLPLGGDFVLEVALVCG